MNVTVTRDRVLVECIVNDAKTEGGILFTHTGEEHNYEAIVIAKGPGRTTNEGVTIPVAVEIGDKLIYEKKAGIPVTIEGKKYLMLKEAEIICIVE